jgi:hypothetical protein
MAIWIPLLIALLGCLAYGYSPGPKVQELGRLAWLAGLIGFCVQTGSQTFTLFR